MGSGRLEVVRREMPFRRADVRVDGVRLSIVDDAPSGGGRGVVLALHGNPTWSFLWRRLLSAAIAAGHRVIAPDHAGFGLSEKPDDPAYYSLDRHVRNLEEVVRVLDVRDATLVLHDWGGPIGAVFAARQPDRVARIVVANTVAFAPTRRRPLTLWHRAFASSAGYVLGTRFNLVARSAFRLGVRRRLPRDVRAAYLEGMSERGGRVAASRFVQLVPDGPEHPTSATLREFERAIPVLRAKPLLVLWADRDPVFPPKFAERWARDFPAAVVKHVSDGGHFWQEDDPDPFIREILAFVGDPE